MQTAALKASSSRPAISAITGAAAWLHDLPKAKWMLPDRGYDAEWFRDALEQKASIRAFRAATPDVCLSNTTSPRYKRRNRIEIMFGRLKDWRRVATRYDRQPSASAH